MTWTLGGVDPAPVHKKKGDPHSGLVESSAAMRAKLAEEGKPVIVAFSRGKDSICAMIALMEAGVEVIPVHLYRVPGLRFEEESLKAFEDFFQMKILNIPHRDFWYYLVNGVGQAPWQNSIAEAAGIVEMAHSIVWREVRDALGLPEDTWVADGIRAADSPARRISILTSGPWTSTPEKCDGELVTRRIAHVVWDWKIADIRACLKANKVHLPRDYDLFDRTFDGLDYRFIKPISEQLPEDWETILHWFPATELELMRHEFI